MKSNLLESYEKALAQEVKTRPLALGDGGGIDLPRLSLQNEARFELWMRRRKDKKFSLASTQNRALLQLARAREEAKSEWLAAGNPTDFAKLPEGEQTRYSAELTALAQQKTAAYVDEVFCSVDREAMEYALYLTIRQVIDPDASINAPVVWRQDDSELPITEDTVGVLLSTVPGVIISSMFLWVTRIQDWADAVEKPTPASADEALDQVMGDPKASESEPNANVTSSNGSPSSLSPTEEEPAGSGD